MNKKEAHVVTGMVRDMSAAKFNPNFVFDARNIRITARGKLNSLLAVTNEKGTLEITLSQPIVGTVIGNAAFTDTVVLFTTEEVANSPNNDRIYKVTFNDDGTYATVKNLTQHTLGSSIIDYLTLGFDATKPIETYSLYETADIKKVYWIDGINQPRVINICDESERGSSSFDFIKDIVLSDSSTLTVTKKIGGGQFPAGEVQYCFNYFDKFGQQTPIVQCSPLFYLSPSDRGLPADGTSNATFEIVLKDLDSRFDYVRIYSILSTSEGSVPNVRIVGDFKVEELEIWNSDLNDYVTTWGVITSDNGTYGSAIDATALLFIGGEYLIPSTMAVKDNTLFLGNIKENKRTIGDIIVGDSTIKDEARNLTVTSISLYEATKPKKNKSGRLSFYDYYINNNLPSTESKTFKYGEGYRLGFIAQDLYGKWSEAVWINDVKEEQYPSRIEGVLNSSKWSENTRAGFSVNITTDMLEALYNAGYRRVAPVVVYPSEADRYIVCQGILSGTVYNVGDRANNSPFAQADWRFRTGYSWDIILNEIQLNSANRWTRITRESDQPPVTDIFYDAPNLPATKNGDNINTDFKKRYSEYFYRDPSILTFHSPDIEFSDTILGSDLQNLHLRIVGVSNLYMTRDAEVIANYNAVNPLRENSSVLSASTAGFEDFATVQPNDTIDPNYLYFDGYVDSAVKFTEDNGWTRLDSYANAFVWRTYLWHKHGSLSNAENISNVSINGSSVTPLAKLGTKCISEISYAKTTFFNNVSEIDTTDIVLFSKDSSLVEFNYQGNKKIYYGNIDKVLPVNSEATLFASYTNTAYGATETINPPDKSAGYPVVAVRNGPYIASWRTISGTGNPTIADYQRNPSLSKDPVYIKYKSSPHVVVALGKTERSTNTLYHLGEELTPSDTSMMFWDSDSLSHSVLSHPEIEDNSTFNSNNNSVFIAELYREFTEAQEKMRFGGTSQEALALNDWKVCGDVQYILIDQPCTLTYEEGDTYFARYDCLKVYPSTHDDENSIVSIYSTEVESRVNLDLRYDRNRGLKDNTLVTPENFNLFNRPGYEQTNRYFTYHSLDYDKFNTTHFPNMVTWSLEKTLGEEIDTWTEMSMMSTFDMEGSLGEITKLATFGNELFGFQQNGIAQVLYNSRVQIPTSDGQPIEITNGLKYGGLRYISRTVGLTNKWSMVESPLGLYFVDDTASTLYRFTGQLTDVSTSEGFNTWFSEVCSHTIWNPKDFGNIKSFYDKANKDVYFVTKDTALVFSEQLGKFTSFMDYSKVTDMFSVGNRYFAIRNVDAKIWQLWKGKYNSFFGEFKPFWITFVSNDGQTTDKVYDTLEWRTQSYSTIAGNTAEVDLSQSSPFSTFDTLRVWNDHQDTLDTPLVDTKGKSYNLKKKFNVFRALVPRDKSSYFASFNRDRIRNPWTFIKLGRALYNEELLVFNDLVVNYFE